MSSVFDIRQFSGEALAALLIECSHRQAPSIAEKPQVGFLSGYLEGLSSRAILVESAYTDRDFLEDYAAYYVRCFQEYPRKCTRLHFFDREIDEDTIARAVLGDRDVDLQTPYLGFVVVKPLPSTVIGRTCLKPFGPARGRSRVFPTLKTQTVDLFGVELRIDSLPFQEQDREVAACASSSLWTTLHSTSRLFQHAMPSPGEITKAATVNARLDGRTFPNGEGLNALQISEAIRSVGLEPSVIGVGPHSVDGGPSSTIPAEVNAEPDDGAAEVKSLLALKIAIFAYLRAGLACILLARTTGQLDGDRSRHGNHAVAVTGFGLNDGAPEEEYPGVGTRFAASRIDRLYVHDDQTGPFTSYRFSNGGLLIASNHASPDAPGREAEPVNLIVPLYHKIRIPLGQVVEITLALDAALHAARDVLGLRCRFEWDIQLVSLQSARDQIVDSPLDEKLKLALLTQPMPRFVWKISAAMNGRPAFDLLLDATDLLQGDLVRELLPLDPRLCGRIANFLSLSNSLRDPLASVRDAFRTRYA